MDIPQHASCLSESGRRLWIATVENRCLTQTQMELLLLACKQSDRAAEARVILTSEKIVALDRFDQEKPHPAVLIERAASLACATIIAQIIGKSPEGVPTEDPADEFFN